jgi:hypothetical protein
MSKSAASTPRTRVQKVCTLWTHDDNFSRDDVVFNSDKFAELPGTPGRLIQVIALKHGTSVRDFQTTSKIPAKDPGQANAHEPSKSSTPEPHSKRRGRRGSIKVTIDENGSVIQESREVDLEQSYVFVAKPFPADLRAKHPNLQISIAEKIAKVFGLRNRVQVIVTLVSLRAGERTTWR